MNVIFLLIQRKYFCQGLRYICQCTVVLNGTAISLLAYTGQHRSSPSCYVNITCTDTQYIVFITLTLSLNEWRSILCLPRVSLLCQNR